MTNKVLGVNTTVFTIPNLTVSDRGDYYCTVTNEWDRNMESNSITVTVKGNHVYGLYIPQFGIGILCEYSVPFLQ